MAAPYTGTTDLANLVTAAYDRLIRLQLRAIPMFRQFADTKPVQQTHPGSSVIFNIHQDLAPVTAVLDETTDPAGVSLANTTPVTVTLNEYGNYTVVTQKLESFALDSNLDGNLANILAFNQADSVDRIVRGVLGASTNVIRVIGGVLTPGSGAVTGITATDSFSSKVARLAVAKLRGASVVPWTGEQYAGIVHPDVAHDLRVEAGPNAWRTPHEQVDTSNLYAGEIGSWEGIRWVENPRCLIGMDSGATGTNVYDSYIIGREALAEAVAVEFKTVVNGTISDPLDRKTALGWYGIAGWNLFRPQSMFLCKTSSTIGINTVGALSFGDSAKSTKAAKKDDEK